MEQEHKDPGWRKMAAWGLIWLMAAYIVAFGRVNHLTGELLDIPANVERMLTWATSGFFAINGAVHIARAGASAFNGKTK